MRSNITHDKLTKMMFGFLPMQTIRRSNRRVDNPTPHDKFVSKMVYSAFPGMPGPIRYGHRSANHDIVSASIAGYTEGGYHGMIAAMAHIAEDMVSDNMLKSLGSSEARDLWESAFNYST